MKIIGMRKFLLFILLSFTIFASAQPYGNEWINPSQHYFKMSIVNEGIYRINYNTLSAALSNTNQPIAFLDPRYIQIFHNGEEQYIFVNGENDSQFGTDDYIEFYANRNDGSFDKNVFDTPASQANSDYSLFNDTATYFLTFNSSITNKRLKVIEDNNFAAYTPLNYILKNVRKNFADIYLDGKASSTYPSDPEFTESEGWFGSRFGWNGSTTITYNPQLNTPEVFTGANTPPTQIEIVATGASNTNHHLTIDFLSLSQDYIYFGYKLNKNNFSIAPTEHGAGLISFMFSVMPNTSSTVTDYNCISYINVLYAHKLNFENLSNFHFYIPNGTQAKSYLDISNLNITTGDSAILYDFTNHKKIKVFKSGNNYRALIPNPTDTVECFITSGTNVTQISSLKPVSNNPSNFAHFTDFSASNTKSSNYIIISHKDLQNQTVEYKNYLNIKGFNTLLVDENELYDQYAYGIGKHPLAIRNFLRYAINEFDSIPKYLFLIGKAYKVSDYRNNSVYYKNTLVPSMGNPPSDILFTSKIKDQFYAPAIPTGRLSAKTLADVEYYLAKVKQHDNNQTSANSSTEGYEWMKQILHFGGGNDVGQQNLFRGYLRNYETIIEDTAFGGNVSTFLKTTSDPIQQTTSDTLKNLINTGVSMLTFFGHASGNAFDNSIANFDAYNNYGKYPFLLANSCLAGDLFGTGTSSSEDFVLEPNKGVIGYLASVTLGMAYYLNIYSNEFYKSVGYKNYGEGVGDQIQHTIQTIQSSDQGVKEVCLAMALHGDPAVKINYFAKPDYVLDQANVYMVPTEITTTVGDSFELHVISKNKGKAINKTFFINVTRTFPDGHDTTISKNITATQFQDNITFKIPVDKIKGVGLNTFKITLDALNQISEISEFNNSASVNVFIRSADLFPIYPYKFAVIPTNKVILKASTGDPFATTKNFIFQIDTSDSFNNPTQQIVNHLGGVVTWTCPLTLKDSTVYYWRVCLDPSQNNGLTNWKESSFQYINGKSGWGQAHFFQYKDDTYEFVKQNRQSRNFEFVNSANSIDVQTAMYPYYPWWEIYCKLNNVLLAHSNCNSGGGYMIFTFSPINCKSWYPPILGGGSDHTCQNGALDFISNNFTDIDSMRKYISNIPTGYRVVIYTYDNHRIHNDTLLWQAFESIGSSYVRSLQNNIPYIISGKKGLLPGNPLVKEMIAPTIQEKVTLSDTCQCNWKSGFILSGMIGPSAHWGSLHWRYIPLEHNTKTDSVSLYVLGIKQNGTQDTVIKNLSYRFNDILNLSDSINANQYPYIKLLVRMSDEFLHSPAQMNRWQVLYDEIPETALDPSFYTHFYRDTLTEGDIARFAITTRNISRKNMDSLLIKYWTLDPNRMIHTLSSKRVRPHPAGDVLVDSVHFSSRGMTGLNSLWVEVNPNNDQLEQYHFNNTAQKYFYVYQDKINPLLDVTFDGIHILNGDIVSAKPLIEMRLKDENKFLAINDTSLFSVYLQGPSDLIMKRINFTNKGQEVMRFTSATLPDNTAKIEFPAEFPDDGIYTLTVQGKDASQNKSGESEYKISFEVINKSTITNLINWPNPFSTSTHFVFTLTGSVLPTFMKIQVLNISGKVVKEIDQSELGPIHIGRNLSLYTWDGTDTYGARLANGVYLYRVLATINGEEIEKRTNSDTAPLDKYFTKSFGKMYLIR